MAFLCALGKRGVCVMWPMEDQPSLSSQVQWLHCVALSHAICTASNANNDNNYNNNDDSNNNNISLHAIKNNYYQFTMTTIFNLSFILFIKSARCICTVISLYLSLTHTLSLLLLLTLVISVCVCASVCVCVVLALL